jgi:hypothetical protein
MDTPCTSKTHGLLRRASITVRKLIPVGKETDRHWEQGEDPSMIDSDIFTFEKRRKLVIADPSERKKWSALGLRRLMKESKLAQAPVSNVTRSAWGACFPAQKQMYSEGSDGRISPLKINYLRRCGKTGFLNVTQPLTRIGRPRPIGLSAAPR